METEFQNAVGKSMGEVMRDIADFLSTPYIIGEEHPVELCSLIEDLNMHAQFSFALLSEAKAQGWTSNDAEAFYRRACAPFIDDATVRRMLSAFRDERSEDFLLLSRKYGNGFRALDGSYWATVLSVGIDADEVEAVMHYLRLFTVLLMEFAYMEDRNPSCTYAWCYFEAFREALESFADDKKSTPLPLKIGKIGGSTGNRTADGYHLSLGIEIHNPNPHEMARGVSLDITLKDKAGKVLTVIGDRIEAIDPDTVYHYALTRRLRGAAVGSISASVRATRFLTLPSPVMNHVTVSDVRTELCDGETRIFATVKNGYDRPLPSLVLHYQLLSDTGKPLGGGAEWLLDGLGVGAQRDIEAKIPMKLYAASTVFSTDFDALALVAEEGDTPC